MLSYGLLPSIKNSCMSQKSNKLLSSLTRRYHNNVIQIVASHKIPFMKYYSKATLGVLASSLVLACSITQSDELPNNTVTSNLIESTLPPPTSTATTITTITTTNVDPLQDTAMFPPIQPYHKGMLQVSDVHSIAFSVYGNPVGKPVLGINNFTFTFIS